MTPSGHHLTWRCWGERPLFLLAAWLSKHCMLQRLLRIFQFLMLFLCFRVVCVLSSPESRGQQAFLPGLPGGVQGWERQPQADLIQG